MRISRTSGSGMVDWKPLTQAPSSAITPKCSQSTYPTAAPAACFCATSITGAAKDERVDAAWVDELHRAMGGPHLPAVFGPHSKPMLGGVRGSQLFLPRFSASPNAALYTEAADGRPIFVLPWNEQCWSAPPKLPTPATRAEPSPSHEEIEYLLRTVANCFPKRSFRHRHQVRVRRNPSTALFARTEALRR